MERFKKIWVIDTEYTCPDGHRPTPICLCGVEVKSGRQLRRWLLPEGGAVSSPPPFPAGPDTLVVVFSAPAEMGVYLQLGWPLPHYVLDLYAEWARKISGLTWSRQRGSRSLLRALRYYNLPRMSEEAKEQYRAVAIRGGPFSATEKKGLLSYCMVDVQETAALLDAMRPEIDLPRALIRGWYTRDVARIERAGIPIDMEMLDKFKANWGHIKEALVEKVNETRDIYVGHRFNLAKFADFLDREGLLSEWPRTKTGRLSKSEETFKDMAKMYPRLIGPVRELEHVLGKMKLIGFTVGPDNRNRCSLNMFGSVTGRNQPSSARYLWGPSTWMRGLLKPEEGRAIGYCDWSSQEFGVAAKLSGDEDMQRAYLSGDPYLWLAKEAGAIPPDGTKATHGGVRDLYKTVALAVQYGQGARSLGLRLGTTEHAASRLILMHQQVFPRYWWWVQARLDLAMQTNELHSVMGWRVNVTPQSRPTSLANFSIQAAGADMLRVATILLAEAGIEVISLVHDAVVVEADADDIGDVVAKTQDIMAEASRVVLQGFELRSDSKIVRYPDRYMDPRGEETWGMVQEVVESLEASPTCQGGCQGRCQAITQNCMIA
jgi:DNA polymerase I-like protein with 3'-5' exonuclease and polymerase domains